MKQNLVNCFFGVFLYILMHAADLCCQETHGSEAMRKKKKSKLLIAHNEGSECSSENLKLKYGLDIENMDKFERRHIVQQTLICPHIGADPQCPKCLMSRTKAD